MRHASTDSSVDLDRLLKLRIIVARVGEMDLAQWWNTRSTVVSSFTIVKGAMIDETYKVFTSWDTAASKRANLDRLKETNYIGAPSEAWLRYVAKVFNRRFDPIGADRALLVLAKAAYPIERWRVVLLWHFGLLKGRQHKQFASYHVPGDVFLYVVHAMREGHVNAGRIIDNPDWRMFLMQAADVERELPRLHQFRKLDYEVAGSLVQLSLPCTSSCEYAEKMVA